jgi:hypothetical protein
VVSFGAYRQPRHGEEFRQVRSTVSVDHAQNRTICAWPPVRSARLSAAPIRRSGLAAARGPRLRRLDEDAIDVGELLDAWGEECGGLSPRAWVRDLIADNCGFTQ